MDAMRQVVELYSEMSPNGSGGWTEVKLHSFGATDLEGATPYSSLMLDGAGNLYGTTQQGGNYTCGSTGCGTVYRMTLNGGGHGWTVVKLHNFGITATDGSSPYGALITDNAGNLYGTTYSGGDYGVGTMFEITP